MGIANANVARMVINDLNARGGLLGRQIDLHLEDSATTDSVAEAKATKLVQQDHVDVIFGGIYSSTRQAIKGPAVVQGKKLYIYPEQYEGQECDPLIFCTGPVPAQQVEPLIPWLMQQTGAKKFYLPSADYIWPHVMNEKVREAVTAHGGEIVGEEYFPLDHTDYGATVEAIDSNGAEVVFNTIVPPGLGPFLEQLYNSGFTKRGGHIVCTYFEENILGAVPAEYVKGLYGCLDYYQDVSDPFSQELLKRYDELSLVNRSSRGAVPVAACIEGCDSGKLLLPRPVRSTRKTLSRRWTTPNRRRAGRSSRNGPGQHHARLNMYIARSSTVVSRLSRVSG